MIEIDFGSKCITIRECCSVLQMHRSLHDRMDRMDTIQFEVPTVRLSDELIMVVNGYWMETESFYLLTGGHIFPGRMTP